MHRFIQLYELIRARFLIHTRERGQLLFSVIVPFSMVAFLGYLVNFSDDRNPRIGVVYQPNSTKTLSNTSGLKIQTYQNVDEARDDLVNSRIDAFVNTGDTDKIYFDGRSIRGENARLHLELALRPHDRPAIIDVTNGNQPYMYFLFPGLLGFSILGPSLRRVAGAIVDMRVAGTLKRLQTTPMSRVSFLVSFVLTRMLSMSYEVSIFMVAGIFILGIPFDGSLAELALVLLAGTFSLASFGLLIGSRGRSPQSMFLLTNFVMITMSAISGVFFSLDRVNSQAATLLKWLPPAIVVSTTRSIMTDGAMAEAFADKIFVLMVTGTACSIAAWLSFRWD